MSGVPFTDREMRRAWEENLNFSQVDLRSNTHRLLLFYAVECGLKAILMKRRSANCTHHCQEIGEAQHNINKLLDILGASHQLKLPSQMSMGKINDRGVKAERKLDPGKINQAWRYGGKIVSRDSNSVPLTDKDLENALVRISEWIKGELR
jgi:hypothetical protein